MALVDYGSSTSSECEEEDLSIPRKRPALPTALTLLGVKQPKCVEEDDLIDDPTQHGGRIRTFKHERGNWATHVYVSALECNDQLEDFQLETISKMASMVELKASASLHLSLSKTVVLQYHQIDVFASSLQQALRNCVGFSGTLHDLKIYTNEERTRTFLAVQLDAVYSNKMHALLRPIDGVMRDFGLPQFYADPSFHISLLWCVGNEETLMRKKLEELQQLLNEQEALQLTVNKLHCKCGNKEFIFRLNLS
ncbi:U6 snRNA phosphodiesterase [Scaptodrosophila lebanonensis]|uniref:U6 snRNA phosphodiesterase n=1 Tax=Drosophila lebanonensis TaxID=7225 RepID=A0A6J2THK3_DROLE|nr:U6 snRNA phosphodiesterase [Scaptodrosophila lebanonensis]